MTLLGKWFTVAIALLSFAFFVLALVVNASHRNWKDVVLNPETGLKKQIETIHQTNLQLRDDRDRTQLALDREQASRQTALAALQTQLDQVTQMLQENIQTVQTKEAQNKALTDTNKSHAENLALLTDETRSLREQIRKEQEDRDTLFAKTLELTDLMNRLRGTVQEQTDRNAQLMAEVTRYKEVVDARGIDINEPLDGAPPDRNGTVLVLDRPRKLVEVSIGSDDGLREGHLLDVTRRDRFVARLRVRRTEPDRAVAEILSDYSEGIIERGDRVETTFE